MKTVTLDWDSYKKELADARKSGAEMTPEIIEAVYRYIKNVNASGLYTGDARRAECELLNLIRKLEVDP